MPSRPWFSDDSKKYVPAPRPLACRDVRRARLIADDLRVTGLAAESRLPCRLPQADGRPGDRRFVHLLARPDKRINS